jgi:hypothetical protein
MVLPCEDNVLRNVCLDRANVRVGRFDRLPVDIEQCATAVIEGELALARTQDVLRHDLEVRYDYSLGAAFRSIDRHHQGRVDTHNLGAFLRSVGHFAGEHELLAIVRRMDTDGNCSLSFSEFSDFMAAGVPAPALPLPIHSLPLPPPVHVLPHPALLPHPADLLPLPRDPLLLHSASYRYLSPVEKARIRAASPLRDPILLPRPRSVYRSPVRMPLPAAVPLYVPSPRRYSPVRPVYHSPIRPIYHSPVRTLYHSPIRPAYVPLPHPVLVASPSHLSPSRKPILHLPEEDHLVSSLKEMVSQERALEAAKTDLVLKADFNLADAF